MEQAIAVVLLAAALVFHEMGHWALLRRYGVRVREYWLGLGPVVLRMGSLRVGMLPIGAAVVPQAQAYAALEPRQRMYVALAGPAASALYGMALGLAALAGLQTPGMPGLLLLAGLNLFIAALNVLPVPPLDGFQALAAWRESRGRPFAPAALGWAYRLGNGVIYGVGFLVLFKIFFV
jgi:membrane-associated protease RseP (regulator of RpoE activity)